MRNMIYMTRMGLWGAGTPFKTFQVFEQAAKSSGSLAVLMLVAMEMKVRIASSARGPVPLVESERTLCGYGGGGRQGPSRSR